MTDLAFRDKNEPEGSAAEVVAPPTIGGDVRPVPRISIQAFCESPDLIAAIEAAAGDRRMARAHVKVQTGGVAAAAEFYQGAATPNLIIVETRLSHDRLMGDLDRLAEVVDSGTKVVVVGQVNDVQLYRQLIQRGVSEYLVAPVDLMGIIKAVADLYIEHATQPLGRTVAFIGAKGGVGASMLAHNVAWSISRKFDSDVILADLDLAFGTAGLDFNQDPAQGIAEAVNAPERLDDNFVDRLLARCSDHLSLLAAPATLERAYDFSETAFEQIIDIAQAGVPAVILDVPHAWNAWVRKTLLGSDEIVLVAEPDLANLRNAKNLADFLRQSRPNDSPPRLVMNRIGLAKRPEIGIEEFATALELTPIAAIPFDAQLFGNASNNGQMIAETDAKSPIAESFDLIARAVTGRAEPKRGKRSAFAPLIERLRGKKSA